MTALDDSTRLAWIDLESSLRVFCEAKGEAISLTIPNREIASSHFVGLAMTDLDGFHKEIASLLAMLTPRNDGAHDTIRQILNGTKNAATIRIAK